MAVFDTCTSYVHVVNQRIVAGLGVSHKLINIVANVKNAGSGDKTHETDLECDSQALKSLIICECRCLASQQGEC
jgi:hypothetical protein